MRRALQSVSSPSSSSPTAAGSSAHIVVVAEARQPRPVLVARRHVALRGGGEWLSAGALVPQAGGKLHRGYLRRAVSFLTCTAARTAPSMRASDAGFCSVLLMGKPLTRSSAKEAATVRKSTSRGAGGFLGLTASGAPAPGGAEHAWGSVGSVATADSVLWTAGWWRRWEGSFERAGRNKGQLAEVATAPSPRPGCFCAHVGDLPVAAWWWPASLGERRARAGGPQASSLAGCCGGVGGKRAGAGEGARG